MEAKRFLYNPKTITPRGLFPFNCGDVIVISFDANPKNMPSY